MRHSLLCLAVLLLAAGMSLSGKQAPPATGAGAQAGGARYKLLRSVSGTKGSTEDGRFVIEDPRTVFYVPDDKLLFFYFEWEGPHARHRLEGVWMDPTGKVASVSAFDYEAVERRFGARWSLPVGAEMALGTWSFDVRIDGEAAGRHSFQIVEGEKPADLPVARRPLSAADAYRLLQAGVLFVDALDESGGVVATGLGFVVRPDRVATAFETVDGASSVRVRFPNGTSAEVRELAAVDRWQDWVVLPVATGSLATLREAASPAWQVGDHVYSLALSPDGGVTLVNASIMGTARPDRAGERITVTPDGLGLSSGAPVLNEFGDVVAMIADQTVPGASTLPRPMSGPSATESLQAKPGVYTVGIERVQSARERVPAVTFAQLTKDAVFTPRLSSGRVHVARATTAHGVQKERNWFNPIDESAVFSRAASSLTVVLNLRPRGKLRLLASCVFLDMDGRKLGQGKAMAVKADVKDTPAYAWQIPLATISPGLYRVDIVFDDAPVWRTFVRITE